MFFAFEFDDGDYEKQDDIEFKPVRHRKSARRRANSFIDAEPGMDGDASGYDRTDNENDDLDNFIVADDLDSKVLNVISLVLVHSIFQCLSALHFLLLLTTVYKSCIHCSALVISIRCIQSIPYKRLLFFKRVVHFIL